MTSSQSDTFKQSYETLRLFNCELNFEWHAARTSQAEMATLPRASEALSRLQEKNENAQNCDQLVPRVDSTCVDKSGCCWLLFWL